MSSQTTTTLVFALATGVFSSLVAGLAVYRLQRRADRALALETGQLEKPRLVVYVRDGHGSVSQRTKAGNLQDVLRWWHFIDPGDTGTRKHEITVSVANIGDGPARGVTLRVRVPRYLAEEETPEYAIIEGISPGSELTRQVVGGYVVTSAYTPVIAPGTAVNVQAYLILRSTLIEDIVEVELADGSVQELPYEAELRTIVTIDATDDHGMTDPLRIDVQVSPRPVLQKLRRDIRQIDAEEREAMGLSKRSWLHPFRYNRFLAQRPAVGHHHPVTQHIALRHLEGVEDIRKAFVSYTAVCVGVDWVLASWGAEVPAVMPLTAARGLRRKRQLSSSDDARLLGGPAGTVAYPHVRGKVPPRG